MAFVMSVTPIMNEDESLNYDVTHRQQKLSNYRPFVSQAKSACWTGTTPSQTWLIVNNRNYAFTKLIVC